MPTMMENTIIQLKLVLVIGKKYTIVFKTENFKMIQGGYDVEICFDGIAHFKNVKDDIAYWVATETKESKV